ncbi:MAG: hypothetical protein SFU27_06240 [Thermonemataceae bacterium]|nr:hypothetical protein [Thermonemataceae bacterium]
MSFLLLYLAACKKNFEMQPTNILHKKEQLTAREKEILIKWHQANPITWQKKIVTENARGESSSTENFLPQWDDAVVENGTSNKIISVPLHRYLSVAYPQQRDFARRLHLETDTEGNVLNASILEMQSPAGELRTKELDIAKNNTNNFTGLVIAYDLNHQITKTNFYDKGILLNDNLSYREVAENSQGNKSAGCTIISAQIWIDCIDYTGTYGNNTTSPPGSTSTCGYWETLYEYEYCGSAGGNGGNGDTGGTPSYPTSPGSPTNTGGGGGAGSSTPSTPIDPGANYDLDLEEYDENFVPINFTDSANLYKNFKKNLSALYTQVKNTEKLSYFQKLDETKKQRFYKMKNELKSTMKEIIIIEKSKFKYSFQSAPYTTIINNGVTTYKIEGWLDYNTSTQKIQVHLPQLPPNTHPSKKVALEAHEFKHIHQFEKGRISFNKITGNAGVLYDIEDEVEAYKRQQIIDFGIRYGDVDLKGNEAIGFTIDSNTVVAYDPTAYSTLPKTQITIKTNPQGTTLQNAGTNATDIFVNP